VYTVESINNSFVVKSDGVPLFGGVNSDYCIKKKDVFTLCIASLVNPEDHFTITTKNAGKNNIKDLFIDVVDAIYGVDVGDHIRNLNSPSEYSVGSVGKAFIMSRNDIPYYCGPRNSLIVRTDSRKTYLYDKHTMELVQELKIKETDKNNLTEIYEDVVEHGQSVSDSKGLNYIGAWNADSNTPDISATDPINGDYYKVSVAGSTNLNGITDWKAGDWLIFNGNVWEKVDQTESVSSVNGEVGTIVLNPDHLDDSLTSHKFISVEELNKLAGIESGATADQTDQEIKTAYENNSDTNAFTDNYKDKLDGIEDNAEVNNILDENAEALVSGLETTLHKHDYNKLLNLPEIPDELTDLIGTLDDITDGSTYVKTTNDFTDTEKAKLSSIEEGATGDMSDAEIKIAYENNADTNAFTDAEKTKLASLEGTKFLGLYTDLISLQTAHPSPSIGSYAHVDSGAGQDTKVYIWDNGDSQYIEQVGDVATETAESIKTKYESNDDTNAFTDSEKSKLTGIETGAEVNQTDSEIKTQYENNANTNAFTDAYKAKLDGIEEGAVASDGHEELDQVVADLATMQQDGIIVAVNGQFRLLTVEEFFNSMPRIISVPDKTNIYNGESFVYQVDTTGESLLYQLNNFPEGMTISASGLIQYIGIEGNYTDIEVVVSNSYGEVKQNINLYVSGPQLGSEIMHANLNDLMIGENYNSSGNWFNHQNSRIFKKGSNNSKPERVQNYLNGKDVIFFDGDDDYLRDHNEYAKYVGSVVILFYPDVPHGQYGQIFGNYGEGLHIALNQLSGMNHFSFDGQGNEKAKYTLNGTDYTDFVEESNQYPWVNNQWNKLYVEFENPREVEEMTIGSLYPDFSLGSYQFRGYIAMMAIYDSALTPQQVTESFNWIYDEYGI
jgi:hypothetical protein